MSRGPSDLESLLTLHGRLWTSDGQIESYQPMRRACDEFAAFIMAPKISTVALAAPIRHSRGWPID